MGNNVRTVPPRPQVEEYWKSIWGKDIAENNNAQGLVELRPDHSNRI